MKSFTLYFVSKDGTDILLTDYKDNFVGGLTFDENLVIGEHDRYDLNFSIVSQPIPSIFLDKELRVGRVLKLVLEDDTANYINLIITALDTNLDDVNNLIGVTAQDYASYVFSKNNVGLNFDSIEGQEFVDLGLTPNTYNIGNYLLSRGHLAPHMAPSTISLTDVLQTEVVPNTLLWSNIVSIDSGTITETNDVVNDIAYSKTERTYGPQLMNKDTSAFWIDKFSYTYTYPSRETKNGLDVRVQYNSTQSTTFKIVPGQTRVVGVWINPSGIGVSQQKDVTFTLNTNGELYFYYTHLVSLWDHTMQNIGITTSVSTSFPISVWWLATYYDYTLFVSDNKIRYSYDYTGTPSPIAGADILKTFDFDINNSLNTITYAESSADYWKILTLEENGYQTKLYDGLNLLVSSSNTYNALVELAKLNDSILKFKYSTKEILVIPKNNDDYFTTNYRLSPEFNLSELSININGDELFPLTFVTGGEDEYGLSVGLTPTIPSSAISTLVTPRVGSDVYGFVDTDDTHMLPLMWMFNPEEIQIRIDGTLAWDGTSALIQYTFVFNEEFNGKDALIRIIDGGSVAIFYKDGTASIGAGLVISIECDYRIRTNNFFKYYKDWYFSSLDWQQQASISQEEIEKTLRFIDIADKVPYLDNFLFNLEYFKNTELISEADYTDIFNKIYNELRIINYNYQLNIRNKNVAESKIYELEHLALDKAELLAINEDETQKEDYFNDMIKVFLDTLGTPEYSSTVDVVISKTDGPPNKPVVGALYPLVTGDEIETFIPLYDSSEVNVPTFGLVTIGSALHTINSTNRIRTTFDTTNLLVEDDSTIWESSTVVLETYSDIANYSYNWVISPTVPGQDYSVSVSTEERLFRDYDPRDYPGEYAYVTSSGDYYLSFQNGTAKYVWQENGIGSLTKINFQMYLFNEGSSVAEQSWFDIMLAYGGTTYILDKLNYYRDLIIGYIDERQENITILADLAVQLAASSGNDSILIESDIEYYTQQNEAIEDAIGDSTYVDTTITINSFGKFTIFYKYFRAYIYGDGTLGIPSYSYTVPSNTYLELYNISYAAKQDFWYQLKLEYGQVLFEAYYENTLETEPENLYNQAVVYTYNVIQPDNNFSTSMIDISDVIGINLHTLKPGDYVTIYIPEDNTLLNSSYDLQIASVSKELRSDSNIQLTIQKLNQAEKLLEKLLLGLN